MADPVRDELEALERQGWQSLCDGTGGEFYGDLMTDAGVMMLAGGTVLDREGVVASLREAPTWDAFGLEDLRTVALGPDAQALLYRGTARREGSAAFVAMMSSVYTRQDGRWRLAVYTQTPVLED